MEVEQQTSTVEPTPRSAALPEESLTDVIDQLSRSAFKRALERRHAAPPYRTVIESAHLVPAASS
jgi:hypothetical protein